jgi:hypothetical protein
MPYSSVVFNEGEPLDPTKLNKLQESLTEVFKTSLSNATTDDTGAALIPLIHFSKINSGPLVANIATQVRVALPSSFNSELDVIVIAGVAQIAENAIISVFARKDGSDCLILVTSSKTRSSGVAINYIMMQKKA